MTLIACSFCRYIVIMSNFEAFFISVGHFSNNECFQFLLLTIIGSYIMII